MSNLAFNPILTPREMVLKGIFGGAYFGVNAGPTMTKELADFLKVEFGDIESNKWRAEKYMPKRNCFKIRSGMPYGYWLEMNWMHFRDQYGWFEWYVKYNRGFRGEDDDRQIRRWQDFCGPNGRWRNNIYSKIHATGDWQTAPRVQQSLLHWGYTVNEIDYDLWKALKRE